MSKITKEKNLYIFEVEGKTTRTYSLDVNTGVLMNIKTGKSIKRCPVGMIELVNENCTMSNVISLMFNTHRFNSSIGYGQLNPMALALADRLDSVGCDITNNYGLPYFLTTYGQIIADNFNTFVEIYNGNVKEAIDRINVYNLAKQYNIEINDHFPYEWVSKLYNLYERFTPTQRKKYFTRCIYYVERGLYNLDQEHYVHTNDILESLVKCADDLDLPEIPKGDLVRTYSQIKKNWLINQEKIESEKLYKNNYLDKLHYENDIFDIIIPTTPEQFKAEGEAQNNCVYTAYLKEVLDGKTRVVFIRRKDALDKSYITCEVDHSGRIRQYLTRFNYQPKKIDALAFYQEYQNYLNSVM